MDTHLLIYNFKTSRAELLLPKVSSCMPFGREPESSKVKYLLCSTSYEVLLIDTSSFEVKQMLIFEEFIQDICINTLEDFIMIAVVLDQHKIRVYTYRPPWKP